MEGALLCLDLAAAAEGRWAHNQDCDLKLEHFEVVAARQRLFKWYRPGYQHQQRRGSELQPFHIIVDSASPLLQDGRSW